MKDQHLPSIDDIIAEIAGVPIEELANEPLENGRHHLISVDELRAAGAFDFPPGWRKSLGGGSEPQRDLFSDLVDDEDTAADGHGETPDE